METTRVTESRVVGSLAPARFRKRLFAAVGPTSCSPAWYVRLLGFLSSFSIRQTPPRRLAKPTDTVHRTPAQFPASGA